MRSVPLKALALLVALLFHLGCGEVEHCKKVTEPGCLNSVPLADGTCLFDLVPRQGICVKVGSDEDKCSLCAAGDLCVPERNQCINFCAVPEVRPGSVAPPEPIYCVATKDPAKPDENPMLPFEEVCKRRCQLQCRRWENFCPGYVEAGGCEQGYCDRPEVQAQCIMDCPPNSMGVRDLQCLTRLCSDVRLSLCDNGIRCPNMAAPNCAEFTCTNECQYNNEGHAGDGYCDDGDTASSQSASCAWGTDCADCGPRKGTRRTPSYIGDSCLFNVNCEGATNSPSTATSWCVNVTGQNPDGSDREPKITRCAPDCSRDAECPDGFTCRELLIKDPETGVLGVRIEGGVTARACFADMCQPP